jgi:ABC-type transport system involved in multi-copper enzyme maturation permease subunit
MTSVWIIMGSKTGVWTSGFLLGIPITIIAFASLLSVIVLIGVLSESSAVAVMVTVGLMILSPILAAKDTVTRLLSSDWSRELWRALYWVLPKIYGTAQLAFTLVRGRPVESWEALWTSALFAIAVLAIALAYFEKRDF